MSQTQLISDLAISPVLVRHPLKSILMHLNSFSQLYLWKIVGANLKTSHLQENFCKSIQTCATLLITSGYFSKFSSISHSQPSQFMCSKLISSTIPSSCLTPMRFLRFEKVKKERMCSADFSFAQSALKNSFDIETVFKRVLHRV